MALIPFNILHCYLLSKFDLISKILTNFHLIKDILLKSHMIYLDYVDDCKKKKKKIAILFLRKFTCTKHS